MSDVKHLLNRSVSIVCAVYIGLLCADISIDQINETIYRNIYITLAMILLPGALFILLLILWMRKNVTEPLKQLENSVAAFARDSTGKRDPDDLLFTPPDIRTHNEVESLTKAITKLSADMRDYVKDIIAAENEAKGLQVHVSEMNAIAYQDALTHVKNKAAYDEAAMALNTEIANDSAEFAIVMVDLNGLKEINDRCGHEKGNEFIVGCCGLICNVYDHSPVYRVGGDEFVVVLQGQDYRNRDALLTRIRGGVFPVPVCGRARALALLLRRRGHGGLCPGGHGGVGLQPRRSGNVRGQGKAEIWTVRTDAGRRAPNEREDKCVQKQKRPRCGCSSFSPG